MANSKRVLVRLESGSGTFYTTSFNPSNADQDSNKLKLKKFDPKTNSVQLFTQAKSIAGNKKKNKKKK
jgi:ribosomal protein L33